MKLGVLGGTFDPVHNGHLMMARQALDKLALEKVLLIPAGYPMSRPGEAVTPPGHRLLMLRRAVADQPDLSVSVIELDRPGPSYTVDTLKELHSRYGEDAEVYFILGSDSLAQLKDWYQPDKLISLCRLAVVPRPGCPVPGTAEMDEALPGLSERVVMLENPVGDVSATAVRELAAQGKPISHLVPEPVAEYIFLNHIYGSESQ